MEFQLPIDFAHGEKSKSAARDVPACECIEHDVKITVSGPGAVYVTSTTECTFRDERITPCQSTGPCEPEYCEAYAYFDCQKAYLDGCNGAEHCFERGSGVAVAQTGSPRFTRPELKFGRAYEYLFVSVDGGGSVAVSGTNAPECTGCFVVDTPITIKATPDECYKFVKWVSNEWYGMPHDPHNIDGNIHEQVTFTALGFVDCDGYRNNLKASISAVFEIKKYKVTVLSDPPGLLEYGGEFEVDCGDSFRLYSTIKDEYECEYIFDHWSLDVPNRGWIGPIKSDTTVTAYFKKKTYLLHVSLGSGEGSWTVSPSKHEYEYGDTVVVTPNPAHCYEAESPSYTVKFDDCYDRYVTVYFRKKYYLNISTNGCGKAENEGTHYYTFGRIVTIRAYSSWHCSKFKKWVVNGVEYTSREVTLTIYENTSAKAYFEQCPASDNIAACSGGPAMNQNGDILLDCDCS